MAILSYNLHNGVLSQGDEQIVDSYYAGLEQVLNLETGLSPEDRMRMVKLSRYVYRSRRWRRYFIYGDPQIDWLTDRWMNVNKTDTKRSLNFVSILFLNISHLSWHGMLHIP